MMRDEPAKIVWRQVEVCPYCGQWDPFRKKVGERQGRTVGQPRTGLRRVYGFCRGCGRKLILQYRPPANSGEISV